MRRVINNYWYKSVWIKEDLLYVEEACLAAYSIKQEGSAVHHPVHISHAHTNLVVQYSAHCLCQCM